MTERAAEDLRKTVSKTEQNWEDIVEAVKEEEDSDDDQEAIYEAELAQHDACETLIKTLAGQLEALSLGNLSDSEKASADSLNAELLKDVEEKDLEAMHVTMRHTMKPNATRKKAMLNAMVKE